MRMMRLRRWPSARTVASLAADVPVPLRGLSRDVLLALRPLNIDCGPAWKAEHGYYFHSSMIRFSWSQLDVLDKIRQLSRRSRKIAKKARCAKLLPHCLRQLVLA